MIRFFVASIAAWAQTPFHAEDSDVMACLSYERSPFQGDGIRQICIAVFQDGNYTMVSSTNGTNGPVQLEGKMSEEQFQQLKRDCWQHTRFVRCQEIMGGLIRDHAESFVAEISRIEMPAAFQFEPHGSVVSPSLAASPSSPAAVAECG